VSFSNKYNLYSLVILGLLITGFTPILKAQKKGESKSKKYLVAKRKALLEKTKKKKKQASLKPDNELISDDELAALDRDISSSQRKISSIPSGNNKKLKFKMKYSEAINNFRAGRANHSDSRKDNGSQRFVSFLETHPIFRGSSIQTHRTDKIGSILEKGLGKTNKVKAEEGNAQKRALTAFKEALKKCESLYKDKKEQQFCKKLTLNYDYSPLIVDRGAAHGNNNSAEHRITELSAEGRKEIEKAGEEYGQQLIEDAKIGNARSSKANPDFAPNIELLREEIAYMSEQALDAMKKDAIYFRVRRFAQGLNLIASSDGSNDSALEAAFANSINFKSELSNLITQGADDATLIDFVLSEKEANIQEITDENAKVKAIKSLQAQKSQLVACMNFDKWCSVKNEIITPIPDGVDPGAAFNDAREYIYIQSYQNIAHRPLAEAAEQQGNSDFSEQTDKKTTSKPFTRMKDSLNKQLQKYEALAKNGKDYQEAYDPSQMSALDLLRLQRNKKGEKVGNTIK